MSGSVTGAVGTGGDWVAATVAGGVGVGTLATGAATGKRWKVTAPSRAIAVGGTAGRTTAAAGSGGLTIGAGDG